MYTNVSVAMYVGYEICKVLNEAIHKNLLIKCMSLEPLFLRHF